MALLMALPATALDIDTLMRSLAARGDASATFVEEQHLGFVNERLSDFGAAGRDLIPDLVELLRSRNEWASTDFSFDTGSPCPEAAHWSFSRSAHARLPYRPRCSAR